MEPSEKQYFRKAAFGERLAQARIRLKLSQEALAEAVGTTARSISRWEHNQAIPQQYYRERLCEVLQTTPEALFAENEEKQQGVEKQTPLWHVPYPRNPYFTGREDILYQLHERLHQEHRIALTQPQIMSGLGGIGKTQTALEYLYRFRDDYQTVLWVGAETPEILMSDYRMLAHLFQLPEKDSSDQTFLREAVKRWFHSRTNWLLVFDNVEDMERLHMMLPDTRQGHILITTRSQIVGTLGFHIDLQKMEPAEGAIFLLRRAKLLHADAALEDVPPSLLAQANTLVELLDGLPLALDQAGAYIEETACSLSDYLERYAIRRNSLLSSRGTLSNHHPDSVTTTLALAIQQVEQRSPAAADLLRVCAFLHAESIPEELFVQTGEVLSIQLQSISDDPLLLDEAIRKLRRFSLLHREAETKTLSIHRLLQAIIRDRMTRDECRQWINRIIEAMLQIFPSYDNRVYGGGIQSHFQNYFSHALVCATHIEQWDITSVKTEELLYRVGKYLQLWGENAQSLLLLKQAINLAKKNETEHMKVALYLNALAHVYIDTNQYKLAEQCFQQALDVCDNMKQLDLLVTADSFWGLASILSKSGKYKQAQSLAQRALQIKESILGSNHYEAAQVLNILGICYKNQGRYTEAEILFQRSINIYKETLGDEHFFLASCLRNLGSLYDLQQNYIQASAFYQQALQIYKKRMGINHFIIGTTAHKLGNSYFAQKLYQKAELSFREALMIFERLPEPYYFHTAYVLTDLGELYLVQGRSYLAKLCIEKALAIFGETSQIDQVDHQEIVYCLLLAGNDLTNRDNLTAARTYYLRGWTTGKQKLRPDHPLTMRCRDRLETQLIPANE